MTELNLVNAFHSKLNDDYSLQEEVFLFIFQQVKYCLETFIKLLTGIRASRLIPLALLLYNCFFETKILFFFRYPSNFISFTLIANL
jgi:hypothetical protein